MVLQDSGPTNAAEQSLLHSAFEAEHSHLGRRHLNLDINLARTCPRPSNAAIGQCGNPSATKGYSQEGHEQNKPKVLLLNHVHTIEVPTLVVLVVEVSKNSESPCEQKGGPSKEAVMSLKNTGHVEYR